MKTPKKPKKFRTPQEVQAARSLAQKRTWKKRRAQTQPQPQPAAPPSTPYPYPTPKVDTTTAQPMISSIYDEMQRRRQRRQREKDQAKQQLKEFRHQEARVGLVDLIETHLQSWRPEREALLSLKIKYMGQDFRISVFDDQGDD